MNKALMMLIENWRKALDNGGVVGLLSTDMSKAFDCLHHPLLLAKLRTYGFDEGSINLMQAYFTDRYSRVKVGDITSSWKEVKIGCPQGSSFGPLLWNLFQNDLTYSIDVNLCMFADDHQFYELNKHATLVETKLQECAREVTDWYDSNCLKGNYKKYASMIISRTDKREMSIKVKDFSIEPEHNITLLGVTIDNKLSFSNHISTVCKKSSQKVGVILTLRNLIPTKAKLQLFKAAILPHLTYCSTVWHFCKASDSRKLERVQERGLRAVYCDWNSSYSQLLEWAIIPTLKNRRL